MDVSVVFYVDHISLNTFLPLSFDMEQTVNISQSQSARVVVYENAEPNVSNDENCTAYTTQDHAIITLANKS